MDTTHLVKSFIVQEFSPDLDEEQLDVDYDLLTAGIIDSLGLLVVLAWLEADFDVVVDVEHIDQSDFRSVRAICALIESSTSATASCATLAPR